ncbi:MAG: HigA family addiction module antitoxin [Massilia sp.]
MKSLRNPDRRPTHPGAVLREDILPALKMTQAEFAELLDVSRLTVSELLQEKMVLSPELAVRVATLLRTSPESWLRMQEALDLWEVRQNASKLSQVKPLSKERLDLIE